MSALHILVVDDEPDIRDLVKEILEDEGYEVSVAKDAEAARKQRRSRRPDLILLDIWMPGTDGISLLKEWGDAEDTGVPVVMMSGHGSVETAVEATRLGAYDFLEKPLSLAKLLVTVKRGLELARLHRENEGLRQHVSELVEPLGKSELMQTVRAQAERIAEHDAWVLVRGEPGVGRKLFARYIHHCSSRRDSAFVEAGVAGLDRRGAAETLFGYDRDGQTRFGLLEQANGGTLLLDEIGEMDPAIQAKLLTTLETGAFQRVGGEAPVELNIRIIATTHRNLERDVQEGRFREDLYYRLNVVPLSVPSLRERCEDVPELLEYYADFFVKKEGLPYRRFSVAGQNSLRSYHWPGNVRELKNLVQRLLILGTSPEIGQEEVMMALGGQPCPAVREVLTGFDLPLREARELYEKAYLEHQLRVADGSVGKVAKAAGVERTHLYRKLRSLGIDAKQSSFKNSN